MLQLLSKITLFVVGLLLPTICNLVSSAAVQTCTKQFRFKLGNICHFEHYRKAKDGETECAMAECTVQECCEGYIKEADRATCGDQFGNDLLATCITEAYTDAKPADTQCGADTCKVTECCILGEIPEEVLYKTRTCGMYYGAEYNAMCIREGYVDSKKPSTECSSGPGSCVYEDCCVRAPGTPDTTCADTFGADKLEGKCKSNYLGDAKDPATVCFGLTCEIEECCEKFVPDVRITCEIYFGNSYQDACTANGLGKALPIDTICESTFCEFAECCAVLVPEELSTCRSTFGNHYFDMCISQGYDYGAPRSTKCESEKCSTAECCRKDN